MEIKLKHIRSVYSGKPGCCCGCNGKHSYASQYKDEAEKDRGYAIHPEEVRDREVKRIVNLMNKQSENVLDEETCYVLDIETRWYVAYKTKRKIYEDDVNKALEKELKNRK